MQKLKFDGREAQLHAPSVLTRLTPRRRRSSKSRTNYFMRALHGESSSETSRAQGLNKHEMDYTRQRAGRPSATWEPGQPWHLKAGAPHFSQSQAWYALYPAEAHDMAGYSTATI